MTDDTQITGTGAPVVADAKTDDDDVDDSSGHVISNNNNIMKNNNTITRLNTIITHHHYHPHIGIRFCKELSPCSQQPHQSCFSIVDTTTTTSTTTSTSTSTSSTTATSTATTTATPTATTPTRLLRTIDVSRSFCSATRLDCICKLSFCAFTIGTLLYGWIRDSHYHSPHEYLYKMTRWGVVVSTIYFLLSIINTFLAAYYSRSNKNNNVQPSSRLREEEANDTTSHTTSNSSVICLRIRLTWIMFTIAAHVEILVTLLYWVLVYQPGVTTVRYTTISNHGIICVLVWMDGLVLNRIPIRMKHWYSMALPFELVFVLWSILHAKVFPNDEALYNVLDWNESWETALMYSVISVLPLGFILYCLLWVASNYNPFHYCYYSCCYSSSSSSSPDRLRYMNDNKDNDDIEGDNNQPINNPHDLEEASVVSNHVSL